MNDANRKSVKILRGLLLCTGILTLLYSAAMCFVINFNVGIILIGLVGLCLIVAGVFLRALVNAIFNKLRWVLVFPAVAVAMVALQITVISLYAACDDADYTEDAVIVLGAGIDGDKITRQLALRLDAAVEYHSANPDALRAYDEDPDCGFQFTDAAYRDLFTMIRRIEKCEGFERIPKDLPVLFVSGEEDPVGDFGKGVEKAKAGLESRGLRPEVRLYPGMRHEILNEVDHETVYRDIAAWLEQRMAP